MLASTHAHSVAAKSRDPLSTKSNNREGRASVQTRPMRAITKVTSRTRERGGPAMTSTDHCLPNHGQSCARRGDKPGFREGGDNNQTTTGGNSKIEGHIYCTTPLRSGKMVALRGAVHCGVRLNTTTSLANSGAKPIVTDKMIASLIMKPVKKAANIAA
jgi:hypothetical protein